MISSYDVVKALLRTEKGTMMEPERKYVFQVFPKANKVQIKKAVEEIYKVKVHSVNTTVMPGKAKRVRHQLGYTPDWKKAVVTLKPDQRIEVS